MAVADPSWATPVGRSERISPELALVDPELAASARRLLRPPPSVFRPRAPALSAVADPFPEATPARSEQISPELALVDPELAASARRLLPQPALVLVSRAPAVVAPPAARGGILGLRPAVAGCAAFAAGLALIGGAQRGEPLPSPPGFAPVAGGGYVAGSGLRFEVASASRTVTRLTVSLACAGRVKLPSLRLQRDLSFAYRGPARGSHGAATLALRGRFTTESSATVVVRELGPGCAAATTRYVAALS